MSNLQRTRTASVGTALAIIASLVLASFLPVFTLLANAQGNGENAWGVPQKTITVHKYIDGAQATAESANELGFTLNTTWDNPYWYWDGEGDLTLSTANTYAATVDNLRMGATYTLEESLDASVGAHCDDGKPYALIGYTTGTTLEAAAAATPSTDAVMFTELAANQHVIVWNESCDEPTEPTDPTGNIDGQVTGGLEETDPGELEVTAVDATDTSAEANGEFEDGLKYTFHITIPEDEPNLAMKFSNWVHAANNAHIIPVANNMRISSEQDDSDEAVVLVAANTYSSPSLHMVTDLDPEVDGIQVQVLVEVAVPEDTYNGTYSTTYGVQTLPDEE